MAPVDDISFGVSQPRFSLFEKDPFLDYIKSLQDDSSHDIDGLTADTKKIREDFIDIDKTTGYESGSAVGTGILSFLGGWAGGGFSTESAGRGLLGAAAPINSYANNLEKDELARKKLLSDELSFKQSMIRDATNNIQSLDNVGIQFKGQEIRDDRLGYIPGTEAYKAKQADELTQITEREKRITAAAVDRDIQQGKNPFLADGKTPNPAYEARLKAGEADPALSAAAGEVIGRDPKAPPMQKDDIRNVIELGNLKERELANIRLEQVRANELLKNRRSGIIPTNPAGMVTDKDMSRQGEFQEGFLAIDKVYQDMDALIKTKGVSWMGTASPERDAVFGRFLEAGRKLNKAGATFTDSEMENILSQAPDAKTLGEYLFAKARGYGENEDMTGFIQGQRGIFKDSYANSLLSAGGAMLGHKYNPETLQNMGLLNADFIDPQTGMVIDNGVVENYAREVFSRAKTPGSIEEQKAKSERYRQLMLKKDLPDN